MSTADHPTTPDQGASHQEDTMEMRPHDDASGTDSTTARADGTPTTEQEPDRSMRVGTIVWGLVIAAVGVGLLAVAAGLSFDVELALILLVATAGAVLLVGSIASGVRHRDR